MVQSVTGILSAVTLTVSLFTSRVPESAGVYTMFNSPIFVLIIVLGLLLTTFLAPYLRNKADSYWVKLSELMKATNRYFAYFGFFADNKDRALDIRMYRQDKICDHYIREEWEFTNGKQMGDVIKGRMGPLQALASVVSRASMFFIYLFRKGR